MICLLYYTNYEQPIYLAIRLNQNSKHIFRIRPFIRLLQFHSMNHSFRKKLFNITFLDKFGGIGICNESTVTFYKTR